MEIIATPTPPAPPAPATLNTWVGLGVQAEDLDRDMYAMPEPATVLDYRRERRLLPDVSGSVALFLPEEEGSFHKAGKVSLEQAERAARGFGPDADDGPVAVLRDTAGSYWIAPIRNASGIGSHGVDPVRITPEGVQAPWHGRVLPVTGVRDAVAGLVSIVDRDAKLRL